MMNINNRKGRKLKAYCLWALPLGQLANLLPLFLAREAHHFEFVRLEFRYTPESHFPNNSRVSQTDNASDGSIP